MDVMWTSLAWPGTEHVTVTNDGGGLHADSLAVHAMPDGPMRIGYTLTTDEATRTRHVFIEMTGPTRTDRLTLHTDGTGAWTDDHGKPVPDLDGCVDIDISCTPLTNTLPVRRLGLDPGESAETEIAYIVVPRLRPHKVRQRYTRLPDGPDGPAYRYESGTFRADLTVDEHGLVVTYPQLWQRVDPAGG